MPTLYSRTAMGSGIAFTSVSDNRFKTASVSVNLIVPLNNETASLNAVTAMLLSSYSSDYPTITNLNLRLSSLYGAGIDGSVSKIGDNQVIQLVCGSIADRYALEGEKITSELTDILIGCLMRPHTDNGCFCADDFRIKKQQLLDDIDAEINEKRSYAMVKAGRIVYRGESAAVSPNGSREYAEKMTAEEAYSRYKELLRTARIEIICSGAGDFAAVKNSFETAFRDMERSYTDCCFTSVSPLKDKTEEASEELEIAQSKMVMAYKGRYESEPATKLFCAVFGATPFSKLFVNVREKLSLCYYCAASVNYRKGVMTVDSGVETENIDKARAEITVQLNEVKNGNFTDEEMENARLSLVNSLKSTYDSPSAMRKWYLLQAYNGTAFSPDDEIARINTVTRSQLIEAAKCYELDTVFTLVGKGGEE